jgi:hypothetical protein
MSWKMKLLAVILALLIVILTVIPCHDVPQFQGSLNMSEIAHHPDMNGGHPDTDQCSPFCVCQCCQSNVLVMMPFIPYIFEGIAVTFTPYSRNIPYPEIVDFLIPPKS